MNINQYLKKNAWLLILTPMFDYLAIKWWSEYLETGAVYDGRHGITFAGAESMGHLAGMSLLAAILTFYLVISIWQALRRS